MLLVGMTSSIIIATQAMSPPGPQSDVLDAAEVTFIIEDELESAVHVLQYSSSRIRFVTPDRNQDSQPETIEYRWGADNSLALLRSANDEQSVALMPQVYSASLLPRLRTVAEDLGGRVSESSVSSLIGQTSARSYSTWELGSMPLVGQAFDLTHPANAVCWSIDGIWLAMRRDSSVYASDDKALVQVRLATGDGLPTSEVLAESEIRASDLRTSYRWRYIEFDRSDRLHINQNICVVIESPVVNTVIEVLYANTGVTSEQTLIGQSLHSSDWQSYPGKGLLNSLRGTRHTMDDTIHEVARDYISAVTVDMQMTEDTATRVRRGIRLLNSPEDIDQFWQSDFSSASLDTTDANFDGVNDWNVGGADSLDSLIKGSVLELSDGQQVVTSPVHRFGAVTSIDVRLRAASVDPEGGAVIAIPVGGPTSGKGLLQLRVSLNDNGLQTASVVDVATADETNLAIVNGLPSDFVDVRIVIDPVSDQVGVWINGAAQGRTAFTRASSTSPGQVTISAQQADAQFDYVSIRVGRSN